MTLVADIVTSDSVGERDKGTYTGGRAEPSHQEIAQLAYILYESRGRQDGHDVEDWLRAEKQLVRHYTRLRRAQKTNTSDRSASLRRKAHL